MARRAGPLRWYPPAWRDRYGEEFLAFLEDNYGPGRLPLGAQWSLLTGGLSERARLAGIVGNRLPVTERVRAGVLVVFGAWAAFVVALLSFAKLTEQDRSAVSLVTVIGRAGPLSLVVRPATPWVANVAITAVEVLGALAALAVVGGAAFALPAFWRFLRAGGWPSIRGHVLRAGFATAGLAVATAPLLAWAHHLSEPQRNGQLAVYGVTFVGWAGLVALTLALWTAAAIAAARRMDIPWVVLFCQAMVAVAVATAMVVMVGLTAFWWVSVAGKPFWDATTPGPGGGRATVLYEGGQARPWEPWLATTVGLMAIAAAGGLLGAVRIVGIWSTTSQRT